MRRLRSFLPAAGLIAAAGLMNASAGAQEMRRIVITPYAGVFMPTTRVAELNTLVGGGQRMMGIRQQNALALGMTASYWFNGFAGVELGGAWAFSDARASLGLSGHVPGFSLSDNESSRVLLGSAKFMVNLLPINTRSALRLGVGPAIITRGGSAYKADASGEFDGLTDLGGAISLCTRLPLTDFISLRVRAENFMYSSQLRYREFSDATEGVIFRSKLQNDFIFSAGMQMVWWR